MPFDFDRFAERMKAAAGRLSGVTVTISNTDLILSRDGFGTGRSESIPFPVLFLADEDRLGMALDRLAPGGPDARQAA